MGKEKDNTVFKVELMFELDGVVDELECLHIAEGGIVCVFGEFHK